MRRLLMVLGGLVALVCGGMVLVALVMTVMDMPEVTVTDDTVVVTVTVTDTPEVAATVMDTPEPTMGPTATPRGFVQAADWGDDWAFTVEDGVISCVNGNQVVFASGGRVYAMNGFAISSGQFLDIDEVWRDTPTGMPPKVYIGDFTQMGLELCE